MTVAGSSPLADEGTMTGREIFIFIFIFFNRTRFQFIGVRLEIGNVHRHRSRCICHATVSLLHPNPQAAETGARMCERIPVSR